MKGKDREEQQTLGIIPSDSRVCATFYGQDGNIILESYAYEVGFFRFNWHPSLEIMLVLHGGLKAYTEHGVFDLQENDLILINPNEGHASMLQVPGTIAMVLLISQQYLEKMCGEGGIPIFNGCSSEKKIDEKNFLMIRGYMALLYCILSSSEEPDHLFVKAQIFLILSLLLHNFTNGPLGISELKRADRHQNTLHIMVKYINRRFREKITLEDLSGLSGMNQSYISNYFRQHIGIGFHEYLIRKRLAYAVHLLNNNKDSILDIALDAGFPDAKAFHMAFRKYFNISPGKYRAISKTSYGADMKKLYPTRLESSHPVVKDKMAEFMIPFSNVVDIFLKQ